MTSYKLSRFFIAVCSVALFGGCHKQDQHHSLNGATFYVDSVDGDPTPDQGKNGQVTRNFVNFTACIKDNATQAAVMNLPFRIQAGNYSTDVVTDDRGCLIWQELISYNAFQNDEKQIGLTRLITGLKGHSGTFDVELAYDPDASSKKIIYLKREKVRDTQDVKVTYGPGGEIESQSLVDEKPVKVKVSFIANIQSLTRRPHFINDLNLQFLERDFSNYRVDSMLGLTIAHKYRLKFSDAFVRRTYTAGETTQAITTGRFKIYLALMKEGYDAPTVSEKDFSNYIVSANELETTANLGIFHGDVTLQFTDIAALASRLTAVITIGSSEEQPNVFQESSFEGVIAPVAGATNQEGIDLIQSHLNARNIYTKYLARQLQQYALKPIELFEQQSGFVKMENPDVPLESKARSFVPAVKYKVDVSALFDKLRLGKSLTPDEKWNFAKALCKSYFMGYTNWLANLEGQCETHPENSIDYEVRDFVENMIDPVPAQNGPPQIETMNILAGMSFEQAGTKITGHTNSLTKSWNWQVGGSLGASLGFGAPVPKRPDGQPVSPLSWNAGVNGGLSGKIVSDHQWWQSTTVASTTEDKTNVTSLRGVSISAESFSFALNVTTRPCLLFGPKAEFKVAVDKANGSPLPVGKYLCGNETGPQNRSETFYFINENTGLASSPLADNLSSADNPWRMFIRGKDAYALFTNMFQQKGLTLYLNKVPTDDILKSFSSFYITQEFPGLLTQQK